MATPQTNPAILDAWIEVRNRRVQQDGSSLRQIAIDLSAAYECCPNTVRRYLDPGYAERQRNAGRLSERRRYARQKHERIYNRNYRRLTRPQSQKRLLTAVFAAQPEATLSLDQIGEAVQTLLEGIAFKTSTVEQKFLKPFMLAQGSGRIRGPPFLLEVQARHYRYANDVQTHVV